MIIFIGVSGAGKSIQGKMLAAEMGYVWISSGEFLRKLLKGQPRLDMVAGKLLPDQEVIQILDKVLDLTASDTQSVLDGFPRTTVQAEWLISQVNEGRFQINMVFHLMLDYTVAKDRLLSRNRIDDHEAAINQRLSEHKDVTLPIINKLKSIGVVVYDIDASRTIDAVHNQIVELVKKG